MRRLHLWLGMALSAALVVWLLRAVDVGETARALGRVRPSWLLLALVLVPAGLWLRAFRWKYLLEPIARAPLMSLFSATSVGLMANMILPARLGEFVRAYVFGRREGVSASASFATIVVERLLDGFTILLILVAVVLSSDFGPSAMATLRWAGWLSLLLYLATILILVGMRYQTERALRLAGALLLPLGRTIRESALGMLLRFAGGIHLSRRPFSLFMLGALSLLHWGAFALFNYTVLRAFDLPLSPGAPFALVVFQAIAVMLPSSPGFVGTLHYAVVVGLGLYGVPPELGLSVAVVLHAVNFVGIVLPGLLFLWAEGLSLGRLSRLSEDLPSPPAEGRPPLRASPPAGEGAPISGGPRGT